MPKIHKFGEFQNLAAVQTWITDTDPNSLYFRIAQLSDVLTAGKNSLLINGVPELVQGSEIKIEISDANNNVLFLHPVKNFLEGMARIVSIEVYEDTPPGPYTVTVMGHLAQDKNGNAPPAQFATAYNVKWQKRVTVAPEKVNSTTVRLVERPILTVAETLITTSTASAEIRSFANIRLDKLTALSGQVARAKFYARGVNQTDNYQLVGDVALDATELTVVTTATNARVSMGAITSDAFLHTYWESGNVYAAGYLTNPGVTIQYDPTVLSGSMHIVGNGRYNAYTVPTEYLCTNTPLNFTAGNEYTVSATLLGKNYIHDGACRVDVYLSGSAFPHSAMDQLGYKLASFTVPTGNDRGDFVLSANVVAPITGTAKLYFVTYSGDWYIANATVSSATERGFNPDEVHVILPMLNRRLETLEFKAELLDPNSNIVPVLVESAPVFFDGGNYVVRGGGNSVEGDLKVGKSGTGITITANGFTASGAPVAPAPAIYIGSGSYASDDTPFFVGVDSTGTKFSLGRKLTWDGTTLDLSGAINLSSGSSGSSNDPRVPGLIASQSATQYSASAALFSGSQAFLSGGVLYQSVSTLDSKIFTDANGQISRTGNPNGTGLFLTSTYMGYYSGSAWKTYMNNAGNFVLTGSVGSSNYLAWDGNSLKIAGDVTITQGATFDRIQGAIDSSSVAILSASQAAATASQASSSVAVNNSTSSAAYLDAKIFTDTTGQIVKTPATSVPGLYLGATALGFYSGSSFKTYMANNGNFFLTGSASQYLAWDSTAGQLQIAGIINIVGGPTYDTITNTTNTATQAQATASAASASAVTNALSILQTQATASAISASNQLVSQSLLLTSGGLVTANGNIYTNVNGQIVKLAAPVGQGLFLGSDKMGFYGGGQWKTFTSASGGFYLSGTGGDSLTWTGNSLSIVGNVTITQGVTYDAINQAQLTASLASSSAGVNTLNIAQAQATASAASASAAATSASNQLVSSSLLTTNANLATTNGNIYTNVNGQIVKVSAPSGQGLFLGSDKMGFYSSSLWKTFTSSSGGFYLSGTGSNSLTWDGNSLNIVGDITITQGTTYNSITQAQLTASLASSSIITNNGGQIIKTAAPVGSGLYLGATNLGYHNGTRWTSYLDNTGNFYLSGSQGGLTWNSATSALGITGSITALSGVFNGNVTINAGAALKSTGQNSAEVLSYGPYSVGQNGATLGYWARSQGASGIYQIDVPDGGASEDGRVKMIFASYGSAMLSGPKSILIGGLASTRLANLPVGQLGNTGQFTGASNTVPAVYIQVGNDWDSVYYDPVAQGSARPGTPASASIVLSAPNNVYVTKGNLVCSNDVIAYASSDQRLKDNIVNIPSALNKVRQLNGVSFDWNEKSAYEGKSDVGVIAQEVEVVLPTAVVARAPTTTDAPSYLAVDYQKLIPLLIEAIKELDLRSLPRTDGDI